MIRTFVAGAGLTSIPSTFLAIADAVGAVARAGSAGFVLR